jgi:hypothetical protein
MRAADWAQWPGLPANVREADLVRDLGLERIKATRRNGRLSRHDAVIVERPGLRYWLRHNDRIRPVAIIGAAARDRPRVQRLPSARMPAAIGMT